LMADIDGNVVASTRREVCMNMRPVQDAFPEKAFEALADGGWIVVNSQEPLSVTIFGYGEEDD